VIVAARNEATAGRKNIFKCISTVGADLQDTTVEPDIGIDVGGFEIEIVPEC